MFAHSKLDNIFYQKNEKEQRKNFFLKTNSNVCGIRYVIRGRVVL